VPLKNFDAQSISGNQVGEWWVGDYAVVTGTWTGDALQVKSVEPASPPPPPTEFRVVPCEPPPGGWPGGGPDSDVAAQSLNDVVAQRPDFYVGPWSTVIIDLAGDIVGYAEVVGTVGSDSVAYSDLKETYPFNLCVVEVEFSARDLNEVADRIHTANADWHTMIDPAADRVVVKAVVFDAPLATAIGADLDKVVIDVLVQEAPT
jgi:hypothetical protein